MDENWCVFCLAIVKGLTLEQAFSFWQGNKPGNPYIYDEKDVEDMAKMRYEQKMSYKQIGECYGLTDGAVFRRLKRYKETALVQIGTAS